MSKRSKSTRRMVLFMVPFAALKLLFITKVMGVPMLVIGGEKKL